MSASELPESRLDWRPGDVIMDLYEVRNVHEAGGMGLVYRVHHREWGIDLALKSPRPGFFRDDSDKDNFEREAETWVSLGLYPHTASCFYVRRIEGMPHLFAEYVEGGSLSDWIHEQRLYQGGKERTLVRILDIAIQFTWGLHFAHEKGLVHQDVKPSNVLVSETGVAKVTDFGLARVRPRIGSIGETVPVMQSVPVQGAGWMTPAYASPEQEAGRTLSRQTDIWSWGASVLEMFYGELFWVRGAKVEESLDDYLANGPCPDLEEVPNMPPAVAALLRRCFRNKPEDRPADMLEVAGVLEDALQSLTGQAYPRKRPDAADLLADGLNNQAVSLWDLGKNERAEHLWQQAIAAQPHHPESTYNLGLFRWRESRELDSDVLKELAAARSAQREPWRHHYSLAQIHMERGDCRSALATLDEIDDENRMRVEVRRIRALALAGLPQSRRLLRTMKTAGFNADALWMSPDARWAVCGTHEHFQPGVLELWDLAAGEKIRTLEGHLEGITCVHASSDSALIVSGSDDNSIKVWDAASGSCIRTLKEGGHTDAVCSVWLNRKHGVVASGGQDGSAKIWDLESGRCLKTFTPGGGYVERVYVTPDGKRLMTTGGRDNRVQVWDIESSNDLGSTGRHYSIKDLSVDGSQQLVLTCGGASPRDVKLWNITSGECIRTLCSNDDDAKAISLTSDGLHAVVLGERSTGDHSRLPATLRIWNTVTGRCLCTLPLLDGKEGLRPKAISISNDGSVALVAGSPGQLQLWLLAQPAPWLAPVMICRAVGSEVMLSTATKFRAAIVKAKEALELNSAVEAARNIIESRSVSGYERAPDAIALWAQLYRKLPRTRLRGVWELHASTEHREEVHALCVSRDGHRVFSGGSAMWSDEPTTKTLMIWDLHRNGLHEGGGGLYHQGDVVSISVSGNNRCLIVASNQFADPNHVTWWEIQEDIPIPEKECKLPVRGQIVSVALNYDGSRALLGGSSERSTPILELWDTAKGVLIRSFEGHEQQIDRVWISPDALIAVSAGGEMDGRLKIWDVTTGECLQTFNGHDWMPDNPVYGGLAVSEDLQTILTGGFQDRKLMLWNARTGECVRVLEGHEAGITSVCLSSDGRYSFSASIDGSVRIWINETGDCVQLIHAHRDEVTSIALTLDGQFLVSCGMDKHVKFWFLDWELGGRQPCDEDSAAVPFIEQFISLTHELSTDEELTFDIIDQNLDHLMYTLSCVGLGCIQRDGVRRQVLSQLEEWEPKTHRRSQSKRLAGDQRSQIPTEVSLDLEKDHERIRKVIEGTVGNWLVCGEPKDPTTIRQIIGTEVTAEFGRPYSNVVNLVWDIVKEQLGTDETTDDKGTQPGPRSRSSGDPAAEADQAQEAEGSYEDGRVQDILDAVTKEWILCDRPTDKETVTVLITAAIECEYGFYREDLADRIWILFKMHLEDEGIHLSHDREEPTENRANTPDVSWKVIALFSRSSGLEQPPAAIWQSVLPDHWREIQEAFLATETLGRGESPLRVNPAGLQAAVAVVQGVMGEAVAASNYELASAARDLGRHLVNLLKTIEQ